MIYFLVYIEFFKIGLFAVGGGLATIPFLYELAARSGWFPAEKIPEMLALSQLIPGALGINMGSEAGFSAAGAAGAVIAPLGMISPQIAVILIVYKVLDTYKQSRITHTVFLGLKPAACGLLAAAGFLVCRSQFFYVAASSIAEAVRLRECILFLIIVSAIFIFKKHPAVYIAAAAAAGIVLKL